MIRRRTKPRRTVDDPAKWERKIERITGRAVTISWAPVETFPWYLNSTEDGRPMILVNGLTARGVCMDFLSLNLQSLKLSLIAKHGSVCAQCGAKGPVDLDHIEPRSKGRDDRPENLQLLGINCGCHAKKHGVPQWSKNG